jgi:hypothetical protein
VGSSKRFFVGNVKHLKKETQILDVIRVVVVVDGKPKNFVGFRVDKTNLPSSTSGRDQDRRGKSPGAFRRNQTQIIVSLSVRSFQFVELFNVIDTKFVEILLDIVRNKVGDVSFVNFAVAIGGNQIIRLSDAKNLAQTERQFFLATVGGEGATGQRDRASIGTLGRTVETSQGNTKNA